MGDQVDDLYGGGERKFYIYLSTQMPGFSQCETRSKPIIRKNVLEQLSLINQVQQSFYTLDGIILTVFHDSYMIRKRRTSSLRCNTQLFDLK